MPRRSDLVQCSFAKAVIPMPTDRCNFLQVLFIAACFALVAVILASHAPALAQSKKTIAACDNKTAKSDENLVPCTEIIDSSAPAALRENALYNRAQTYRRMKQYDEAIIDYTAAIALNPKDIDAFLNRAEARIRKGRFDEAVTDLTVVIARLPDAPFYPLLRRGIAYLGSGHYKNAIADFTGALQLISDNSARFKTPEAQSAQESFHLYMRGFAEIRSGNAGGEADMQKAKTLKPDVADALAEYLSVIDSFSPEVSGCVTLKPVTGGNDKSAVLVAAEGSNVARSAARQKLAAHGWRIPADLPISGSDFSPILSLVQFYRADVVIFCAPASEAFKKQGQKLKIFE